MSYFDWLHYCTLTRRLCIEIGASGSSDCSSLLHSFGGIPFELFEKTIDLAFETWFGHNSNYGIIYSSNTALSSRFSVSCQDGDEWAHRDSTANERTPTFKTNSTHSISTRCTVPVGVGTERLLCPLLYTTEQRTRVQSGIILPVAADAVYYLSLKSQGAQDATAHLFYVV